MSYALNDKPGVSPKTRERVQAIAAELGWIPSQAARSLSRSHADAVGLVLARPARMLGSEPFYMEFIAGVEGVISPCGIALLLHVVDGPDSEIATYQKWWAQRRVDGVMLVDLAEHDPRIAAVRRLDIPAVCVSSALAAGGLPHIWTNDAQAVHDAVKYLLELGHRNIARVRGIPTLAHVLSRDVAFRQIMAGIGIGQPTIVGTDFSGEQGARATRALLTGENPPTAILYDNDVMAVAGLSVANEMGISVPQHLSLLAWDDSPLCEITHPPLSAMRRDVPALGAISVQLLLDVIAHTGVIIAEGSSPRLFPRGSTAAPR